jgi:Mg2+ and Co2+ transporter CorA
MIPHPENVLMRISSLKAYNLCVTTDWINYALIFDISNMFLPCLKLIELEVDRVGN